MKGFSAFLVFFVKTILLGLGVVLAANGKGPWLLLVSIAIFGFMFVKLGCLGNAPHD
jgi:hypothetical protein